MRKARFLVPVFLLLSCVSLLAQSIPTATLTGKVTSEGGPGLPGVTVTVESANLQGKRDTSSGANGDYIFNLLPPGDYVVTFTLPGMQTIVQKLSLQAARTARADAELKPASVKEAVVV
ncbi:MAG TPA: carboxypeptidase-like regulatory domain-containing protein, partial [Thermoanaerobaculia bacterium]|nr:carboxypeptidase-like regulatory domain-containing protein [Thermoanaerobaculia bacterium]